MTAMRNPERPAWRPVNTEIALPTANSASTESDADVTTATAPLEKKNGSTGRNAPVAKAANDEPAATHGEPSVPGSSPSSSRARVSSATSGLDMMLSTKAFASAGSTPLAW